MFSIRNTISFKDSVTYIRQKRWYPIRKVEIAWQNCRRKLDCTVEYKSVKKKKVLISDTSIEPYINQRRKNGNISPSRMNYKNQYSYQTEGYFLHYPLYINPNLLLKIYFKSYFNVVVLEFEIESQKILSI